MVSVSDRVAAPAGSELIVARQPVFNERFDVIGYELLFRPTKHALSTGRADDHLQGDLMTAQVLFNSVEIGVDRLAGDRLLFCNASRGTLVGDIPIVLPPERTVVEVLESVVVDDEVIRGCERLIEQGFTLAMDDFTWFEGAERILEMSSIVKVDLMLVTPEELPELLDRCRQFGVTLLAEKVEDKIQLELCKELGFDYFQGYLLSRPQIVQGRGHRLEGSRIAVLRIVEHLWDPNAEISTIERFVRADPALCVQILKVASIGTGHGMRRTVRSLYEALILVGSRRLQAWVTLMLVMGHDTAPEETLSTALVRGASVRAAGRADLAPPRRRGIRHRIAVVPGPPARCARLGRPRATQHRPRGGGRHPAARGPAGRGPRRGPVSPDRRVPARTPIGSRHHDLPGELRRSSWLGRRNGPLTVRIEGQGVRRPGPHRTDSATARRQFLRLRRPGDEFRPLVQATKAEAGRRWIGRLSLRAGDSE